MNARTLAVTLVAAAAVAAFAPEGRAVADENGSFEEQRDCMNDAMMFCSQHIFAPDRNERIGFCLWQHRYQISRACSTHLRTPARRMQTMGRPI